MDKNWKKNLTVFLTGQAVSVFGFTVVQFAILWYVTLETRSSSMMTLFTVVSFLPALLVTPFCGVPADKFGRKRVLVISDIVMALVSLIVALLLTAGHTNFNLLLVCAGIRSVGLGLQTLTVGAIIPRIVPAAQLLRVNGIQCGIIALCRFAAPTINGILLHVMIYREPSGNFPIQTMFFVDFAAAVVGIFILIFFVRIPELTKGRDDPDRPYDLSGYFRDFKDGLRYIREQGYIYKLLIFQAVFAVLVAAVALLMPLQVLRDLGGEVGRLTSLEVALSLGTAAGGIMLAVFGGFKDRVYAMAFACFVIGVAVAALGLSRQNVVLMAICGAAVCGIAAPFFNMTAKSTLQANVLPEFTGRVLALLVTVLNTAMPIAMLIFGPAAERVDIKLLLVGIGTALILTGAAMLTADKAMRKAETPPLG